MFYVFHQFSFSESPNPLTTISLTCSSFVAYANSLFFNLLPHFDEQIFQELPEKEYVGILVLSPHIFENNFILPRYFLAGSKIPGWK